MNDFPRAPEGLRARVDVGRGPRGLLDRRHQLRHVVDVAGALALEQHHRRRAWRARQLIGRHPVFPKTLRVGARLAPGVVAHVHVHERFGAAEAARRLGLGLAVGPRVDRYVCDTSSAQELVEKVDVIGALHQEQRFALASLGGLHRELESRPARDHAVVQQVVVGVAELPAGFGHVQPHEHLLRHPDAARAGVGVRHDARRPRRQQHRPALQARLARGAGAGVREATVVLLVRRRSGRTRTACPADAAAAPAAAGQQCESQERARHCCSKNCGYAWHARILQEPHAARPF